MSPQSALLVALAIQLGSVQAAAPYCLAGDSCFPSHDVLVQFEQSLGGNLIKSVPYGSACYSATYDADKCTKLAKESRTFDFRESQAAAVMYINHEITEDGEGCPVPKSTTDGSAPAAINGACALGNMPSYVVNATSADDVQIAVKFAAAHNLRLRIKNSGHDYSGRSAGDGALSIWTRHLNDAALIEGFVAEGSNDTPSDVVSAGPGVNVEELNQWGADNARVTIGGYTPSVGATGGYLLGGGLGPTAPHFGMAVDNALQFEVITADGEKKIANKVKNRDLFWALRGGGGAFGVVTHVWLKAYPALAAVNTVTGPVVCQDRASYEQMIDTLIDLQVPLNEAGQSGLWQVVGASHSLLLISMHMIQAGEDVFSTNKTLEGLEPLTKISGCTASFKAAQYSGSKSYNDAYQGAIWATAKLGSNPGANLVTVNRLVTYEQVNNQDRIAEIKNLILDTAPSVPIIWQNNCGGVARKVAKDATPVNPTWREAFAWVVMPVTGPWSGLAPEQVDTAVGIEKNLTSVFGTPSYYLEQSGYIDAWQEAFWGSNYERLLSIKRELDPAGVFSCPLCVGSESGY